MEKQGLTKQEVIDWALRKGWKLDKWGHLQKEMSDEQYRFKLGKTSVRYEIRITVASSNEWRRLRSGYLKNLSITSEDRLAGMN